MNIVAGALAGTGPGAGWRLGADEAAANHCVAHTLRADGFDASEDGTGRGTPLVTAYGGNNTQGPIEVGTALTAHGGTGRMDFESETFLAVDVRNGVLGGPAHTMQAAGIGTERGGNPNAIPHVMRDTAVRRLMPVECERLQGFPDGHTAIIWRGKPAADGPRYKALGNSWAVNCARWIGRRIEAVESIKPHNAQVTGAGTASG